MCYNVIVSMQAERNLEQVDKIILDAMVTQYAYKTPSIIIWESVDEKAFAAFMVKIASVKKAINSITLSSIQWQLYLSSFQTGNPLDC